MKTAIHPAHLMRRWRRWRLACWGFGRQRQGGVECSKFCGHCPSQRDNMMCSSEGAANENGCGNGRQHDHGEGDATEETAAQPSQMMLSNDSSTCEVCRFDAPNG